MGALSTAVSPAIAISEAAKTKRVIRRPTHHFNISPKAFALYPFMIAPVLPGETLKSLTYQFRAVTDPVDSPIIGWWKETYFFYVKARDTSLAANFEAMILDPSSTAFGSVEGSADSIYNFFTPAAGNAVDWVSACMERVVESYFRSQDEVWNTYLNGDNMPAVKIPDAESSFMNSLWANSEIPTASDTNSGAD